MSSKGLEVKIKKGAFEFIFDKVGQTTGRGFLMGVEIVPQITNTAMINQNETNKSKKDGHPCSASHVRTLIP